MAEAYWTPDPSPDWCVPPGSVPLWSFIDAPLATVALYTNMEMMRRDLNRFDVGGLAAINPFPNRFEGEDYTAFVRHLPEGTELRGTALLFVCDPPENDDWQRVATHELVHALRFRQWDINSHAMLYPYYRLLVEGVARYSEYALEYLDRFDLHVDGPVTIWLAQGGQLSQVPEFLLYEIGASLVDALVRCATPDALWSVLSGPCRSAILNLCAKDHCVAFEAAFSGTYGQSWEAFLEAWARDAATLPSVPGSEDIYQWRRGAYSLRAELLAPLLDERNIERIDALATAVWLGSADAAEFAGIDAMLRGASGEPTSDVLEALLEREGTLISYARERAGAFSEVAEVLLLGIRARKGEAPPASYVRAFVDVVNQFIPIAVQQSIVSSPQW